MLKPGERIVAALTLGAAGEDQLVVFLDDPDENLRHWALVLLCTVLTFGIFGIVWMFVHAMWVRRIEPTTNALLVLMVGIPLQILLGLDGYEFLAAVVGGVATTWAYFSMRSAVEARFGVALSGIMTFFFNLLYLQYHMTDIAEGQFAPLGHTGNL